MEDSEARLMRIEHEYFERCVAVVTAAQRLADTVSMLTRSAEPCHPGQLHTLTTSYVWFLSRVISVL